MAYCSVCGKEVHDQAEICVHCGCRIKKTTNLVNDGNNVARFLLVFFLGFIGSFIINNTSLKPNGWRSRTLAYFFLSIITFGIYGLVAAICCLTFDPSRESNIGFYRE